MSHDLQRTGKMNKALLKWSPAVPIRKPDNLISSSIKDHSTFSPSYENDPKENMNFLMSNEYMRIWFKEKAIFEKNTYTKEQIIKEESKIKRRIIQRMMTYRKPTKNQFIDELIQQKKVHNKLKQTDRAKDQEKMKFKPQCLDKSPSEIKLKSKSKHHNNDVSLKTNKNDEDSDDCENKCEIILCPLDCENQVTEK